MATDWRWCWTPKRLKVQLPTFTTGFVLPWIKIVYYQHLLVSFEELLSLRLSDHFALVVGCIKNNWLNLWNLNAKNTFSDHDSIHGHRNLNYERSVIARHRNFNSPKMCKITASVNLFCFTKFTKMSQKSVIPQYSGVKKLVISVPKRWLKLVSPRQPPYEMHPKTLNVHPFIEHHVKL